LFTNYLDYPQELIEACEAWDKRYDPPSSGAISVTTLIDSPRIRALVALHKDKIIEDVSDSLWKLLGIIVHSILEKVSSKSIKETRFEHEYHGNIISGQIDLFSFSRRELSDWKVTSKYAVENPEKHEEWKWQLNINRILMIDCLNLTEESISSLKIYAILRDWNRSDVFKAGTPERNFISFDIPILPRAEVLAYMKERLIAHKLYWVEDGKVPVSEYGCSDEEKWRKPSTFAVLKEGNAKATKAGFETFEEAEIFAKTKGSAYIVQKRAGKNGRCEAYCPVRNFCNEYLENKSITDNLY
jgi:hypothetical protein